MYLCRSVSLRAVLFLFLVGLATASTFISDAVFQRDGFVGRSLPQSPEDCPVNFEFKNYTIITSKCKGTDYPPNLCCSAFKEFACPYAEELNDLTNNCAGTMFSYIMKVGKYPPGLFSSECHDDKKGLICPAPGPSTSKDDNGNDGVVNRSLTSLIVFMPGVVLLAYLFS